MSAYTHETAQAKVEQARQGANPDWLELAEQCARHVAQFGPPEFTVDAVWEELELRRTLAFGFLHAELPTTRDGRAMGAVMLKLSRAGVIEWTGKWVPSARRGSQRQPVRSWRRKAVAA